MQPLPEQPPDQPRPGPRWGIGDAIGGLLTSVGASIAATSVLFALRVSTSFSVTVFLVTQLATWGSLLLWTHQASYAKGARSFDADFGWRWESGDTAKGILAGFGALVAAGIFTVILGRPGGDPTVGLIEMDSPIEMVVIGACLILAAPLVEELFFRGLFLRAVERRAGSIAAVLVTSVVFALLHVPQRVSLGFLPAFAPIFVLGLVLATLAIRTRRLGPSIAAHMTINALAFAALASGRSP